MTDGEPGTIRLPDDQRDVFKAPLGPVVDDIEAALAQASGSVVAVGDVVTGALLTASHRPSVAVVDGRSERERVDASLRDLPDRFASIVEVSNPPGTITADLVNGLRTAFRRTEPTCVVVDGEEDLAVVPIVLGADPGTTVLYGQPDEGVVVVTVDQTVRERTKSLLERMEGDRAGFSRAVEGLTGP